MQERMEEMGRALSERLRARHKLVEIAKKIVQQMPEPVQPLGIDDVPYCDCAESGVVYQCYDPYDDPYPPYCTGAKAFVCKLFACTERGTDFICRDTLDHTCADTFVCSLYDQQNSHACEGGHGFFCDDDFHCYGDFHCKGKGAPCVPPSDYILEGGKDPTPGDFTCGWPGGSLDDFDCNSKFDCISKDDFRCVNSTDFDCGTGDPIDQFTCGTVGGTTQFQCDGTDFTCSPMNTFSCAMEFQCQKNVPFACAAYHCPAGVTYKNADF